MIDTAYRLETPEGIELRFSPAGPVSRGLAVALDSLIRMLLLSAVAVAVSYLGEMGIGIILIFAFLSEWFYPVFFEVLSNGQTPGKQAMGLRVIHADGTPIGWTASVLRNLLRVVDFLPLFYQAGLVTMLCNDRFQRLGDLAAATVVVNAQRAAPHQATRRVEGARPPPVSLRAGEQRALLSFAERAGDLSAERVEELANHLSSVTGQTGRAGVAELLKISNGIAGRR